MKSLFVIFFLCTGLGNIANATPQQDKHDYVGYAENCRNAAMDFSKSKAYLINAGWFETMRAPPTFNNDAWEDATHFASNIGSARLTDYGSCKVQFYDVSRLTKNRVQRLLSDKFGSLTVSDRNHARWDENAGTLELSYDRTKELELLWLGRPPVQPQQ